MADRELMTRAPELLRDLTDRATRILEETAGLDHDRAALAAYEIADELRHAWGGQQVYVPRALSMDAQALHRQIFEEYNGRNRDEICSKYGISMVWFYAIIKRVRAEEMARRQADLFGS